MANSGEQMNFWGIFPLSRYRLSPAYAGKSIAIFFVLDYNIYNNKKYFSRLVMDMKIGAIEPYIGPSAGLGTGTAENESG